MSFLAPLFFVALAGLAIPVLIHLIQREKKQVVQFPSLMFVRRVPYKSIRRRRIHNWLLLLVRMAAMALIVLAFARPFVSRPNAPVAPGTGAREVVILLDQSYSMAYGDRWQRAQAAARDAVNALGPADRGSVVLFSSGADIALSSTAERERLRTVIDVAAPVAGATRFAPALKVAGGILAESSLPRREVILISDFQRGGWRGEEGARLPEEATLTPVVIGGSTDQPNVAVTAVSLARSTFSSQERATVTAAVVNRGAKPVSASALALEIDGRPVQTMNVDVEAAGSASVTFSPITITSRNMRATVRVASDALPIDNAFNFVVSPTRPVRILVIDRGTGGGALFLTRVLSIGDMPKFETTVRQPEAVSDEELRRAAVVVVNDVAVPAGLARRIAQFVEDGGGLLVALGSRTTWPQETTLLPVTSGAPVDRSRGEAGRLGALEFGHPVFEVFRAPRSGDFSTARFYGYRKVVPEEGSQVLARFDGDAPALVERKIGAGRVLAWASTLDLSWSDLPLKPVFLPFMHRAVRYLAAYTEPAPWLTVGQVLDPGQGLQAGGRVALTPSGRRIALDEEGADVLELTEPGFYEVRRQGRPPGGDVVVVASNVDPSESDLTPMDAAEIVTATVGGPRSGDTARASMPLSPETQERSQRLWWYLLCLGVALLAVDTVLSNRLSKA